MYITEVIYTNLDGEEVVKKLHFNFSKREMIRLEAELEGGIDGYIDSMSKETDKVKILDMFEYLIQRSYGERPDAEHFNKGPEVLKEFQSSLAYEAMFEALSMDEHAETTMAEFIKGVFPKVLTDAVEKAIADAGGDLQKALEVLNASKVEAKLDPTTTPTP